MAAIQQVAEKFVLANCFEPRRVQTSGGFENLRGLGELTVPGNKLLEYRFFVGLKARNKTYETARMPIAYTLQVSTREKRSIPPHTPQSNKV